MSTLSIFPGQHLIWQGRGEEAESKHTRQNHLYNPYVTGEILLYTSFPSGLLILHEVALLKCKKKTCIEGKQCEIETQERESPEWLFFSFHQFRLKIQRGHVGT